MIIFRDDESRRLDVVVPLQTTEILCKNCGAELVSKKVWTEFRAGAGAVRLDHDCERNHIHGRFESKPHVMDVREVI